MATGSSLHRRSTSALYTEVMSTADPTDQHELVVDNDGSIPADQLARLGLGPGAHLRVVEARREAGQPDGLYGSLPDLPDLDWRAFARASDLARSDAGTT